MPLGKHSNARASESTKKISRVQKRNRSIVVPVSAYELNEGRAVVDVATFEGLVTIAKKYESVILQRHAFSGDEYLVLDNGVLFRFRVAPS